ncbi:MAG: hypothetical protein ABEJ67_04150 [Halanaeroarchaeum sp.]
MSGAPIRFEPLDDPPGVAILDEVERRRLTVYTDRASIETADADGFHFPVDAAATVTSTRVHLDRMDHVKIWSATGMKLETLGRPSRRSYSEGRYQIEISAPIKLYYQVTGPFTIEVRPTSVEVSFDTSQRVVIGARSYHVRPAETITIGDDPKDVIAAISTFASSLKTTTPNVSFPTLRGHPPLIELGSELQIPDGLVTPPTGVTIEVPPNRRHVYPIASLAFYLGATVEPDDAPRIVTTGGFEYEFTDGRWIENEVAAVLRQVLLFDAVVRAEGYYGTDVVERELVESLLEPDLSTLYGMPVHERVAEYLSVSTTETEGRGPRWPMTAYVPPTRAGARVLPHVVNELAIVRTPRGTRIDDRDARSTLDVPDERFREYLTSDDRQRLLVQPDSFDDSVEHVWFSDHVPVGATKGTIEAFESALDWSDPADDVSIAVVATDETILGNEGIFEDVYRQRDDLPFSLDTYVEASPDDVRTVLTSGYDFLHFIGETVSGGLVAGANTVLFDDIDGIELGVFLLDADHSFEESLWLARNGALGGIGTVGRVDPAEAVEVGQLIGILLTMGFPLRGALDILREDRSVGQQYVVVGNGSADIAQSDSSLPVLVDISTENEGYDVLFEAYPSGGFRVGSTVSPFAPDAASFIGPGVCKDQLHLTGAEILDAIEVSWSPVRIDGELYWKRSAIKDALNGQP